MQEHEKTLISLSIVGALLALGKMLASDEPMTIRLFFGRIILGSGTSMAAAAVLLWVPGISPLAITGLGAAFGIAGYQVIEVWLRRHKFFKGKNHDTK